MAKLQAKLLIIVLAILFCCSFLSYIVLLMLRCSGETNTTMSNIDDSDFVKLSEPRPGEWRYYFKEKPQYFEDYVKEVLNVKSAKFSTIYIQPLGEMDLRYRKIISKMSEFAKIVFNCEVKELDEIAIYKDCYNISRGQYNADKIIDKLRKTIPKDAIAYIGITNKDLYSGDLNFVFGVGNPYFRTGVYSLVRLESADEKLFLKRSLKLMVHELGHIFSISHCVFYKCIMNGSNSLREADSRPIHFCPIDLKKLQWNVKFDLIEWYQKKQDFFNANGLLEESAWLERRIKKLLTTTRSEE
jgi:archaemetzincin